MNIDRFFDVAYRVDEEAASSLESGLLKLSDILQNNRISAEKKRATLVQLSAYISKKCKDVDFVGSHDRLVDLRLARKELAHGKSSSLREYSVLYPKLWRAIGELGREMDGYELENLLAYNLSVQNLKLSSRGESVPKVVAAYKKIFDAFPAIEKRGMFRNLLLGVFTDAYSWNLLERIDR